MLGDVGCKMGPRWVQEAFESKIFAQLGVLMGILTRPEASGMERLGRFFLFLGILGSASGGGVVQQGGGDLKIPELDSEV